MTAPWLPHEGCTVCRAPSTHVSLYEGRRCDKHPIRFDPDRAVRLHVAGWPDTALAYVRNVG